MLDEESSILLPSHLKFNANVMHIFNKFFQRILIINFLRKMYIHVHILFKCMYVRTLDILKCKSEK
jgi:hypothetical protein